MSIGVGTIIREERRKQKLTLRELANKTGIDYSMISKYENGIVAPPSERLALIASALNLDEDSLISLESAMRLDAPIKRRTSFMASKLDDDQLVVSDSIANRVVLEAANGRCELCGQVFPDGEVFLEAHHVIWLRDGGTPTVDNTVALCPNCHKRIHMYKDPDETKKLLEIAKSHK